MFIFNDLKKSFGNSNKEKIILYKFSKLVFKFFFDKLTIFKNII